MGWAYLMHGQEIPADEFIYYSPAVVTLTPYFVIFIVMISVSRL